MPRATGAGAPAALGLAVSLTVLSGALALGSAPAAASGDEPAGARAAPAYAVMNGSDTAAVIDPNAKAVTGSIPVPGNPHGGAVSPDGRFIYAASMGSEVLSVVDARSGEVVKTIDLGAISHHATITRDGRYLYVAADRLVVIDTATNEIVARIATPQPPFYPILGPDGARLYVLAMGETVAVIDTATNSLAEVIQTGAKATMGHLALDPRGETLYVTSDMENALVPIDLRDGRRGPAIPVGAGPHGVAVSPDGRRVYVGNRAATSLSVIDVESGAVVATREVGGRPQHLALTPDDSYLYVGVNGRFPDAEASAQGPGVDSDAILILDPATLETVEEVPTWSQVHAFLFPQPAGGKQP